MSWVIKAGPNPPAAGDDNEEELWRKMEEMANTFKEKNRQHALMQDIVQKEVDAGKRPLPQPQPPMKGDWSPNPEQMQKIFDTIKGPRRFGSENA